MATTVCVLELGMLDSSQRDSWMGSFVQGGDSVAEEELPDHRLMLDWDNLLIGALCEVSLKLKGKYMELDIYIND